jgi:hypothetical protein
MMGRERLFFPLGVLPVVLAFLGQIFLNLADVGADVSGRGEDGGDVERDELRIGVLSPSLRGVKKLVILDGVVD